MKNPVSIALLATLLLAPLSHADVPADQEPDGAALYQQHCASCHEGGVAKAPQLSLLQIMPPTSILRAMQGGVMQTQAAAMTDAQQRLLAEYLSGHSLAEAAMSSAAPQCTAQRSAFDFSAQPDTAGWGVNLGNHRYYRPEIAGITAAEMGELELKWAFAFPGALRARSQPAIAGGAVFIGSQDGTVYALDKTTGCIRWRFSTVAEVRNGIVVADWAEDTKSPPLLYFGDLVGNVYALNAVTGELVWRDRPDDHPSLTLTASPALHDGRLYVPLSSLEVTAAADPGYACCTFRGGVAVYDARSGEKLHTSYTIAEPPVVVGKNAVGTDRIAPSGSPVWNTPALDIERGVMYVGTGENYSSPANDTSDAILALSLADGSIVWSQQMTVGDAWNMGCETEERINCPPEDGPDYDFGAATLLATTSEGRDLVLAGQKSGDVYALDPARGGAIVWQKKLGRGGIQGGVHFGMALDGDVLYVPMSDFDGGARWPGKAFPGMYAVDIRNGDVLWFTPAEDLCEGREFCQPGLSAAASAIAGGVVAGAMDGVLRAYDKATGKVLWSYDSVRSFDTTDGGTALGGSFGGAAGPVFSDGMMFVNSGYGIYFHMPGNVFLAFGPKTP
ncbi:MAG: dehydrogenase [Haliea sp.]|mgnify:FL=1|uniref:outer membrane protein assembly factor BamB family protein n=1 Tax=Haliea sp. TaxID=1932666 RepID=UPI000C4A4B69|nr:PQQ-binding-like beta-propeller repeat protein [Haliea sp.]MBM70736.1 dehydrogenase [Haliea sp.]|tara:strand:+ start:18968 stop:20818 length:1851 start_codon:yes stop_codon:yes gene_type:complete